MVWGTTRGGLSAGGWTACAVWNPSVQNHVITGVDVCGMNESFDGGETWWPANLGLVSSTQGTAALCADPVSGNLYCAQGTLVGTGTVVTKGGKSYTRWTMGDSSPGTFAGGNPSFWSETRPRSTHKLLQADNVSGTIYVYALVSSKLTRSTDDYATNSTVVTLTQPEGFILDPTDKTRSLVARWGYGGDGVGAYRVTNMRSGTGAKTALSNAPATVMCFANVGTNVYAACGWYGVYRVTGADFTEWEPINTGLTLGTAGLEGQPFYCGLDGFSSGGKDYLFVSLVNAPKETGKTNYSAVYRCSDAQATTPSWTSITAAAANISVSEWGSNSDWWISSASPSFLLGKGTGDVETVACDPNDSANVLVTGRAGAWLTKTATATATSVLWRPAVYGMMGTSTSVAVTDPYRIDHAYTCNTDHILVGTDADFAPGHIFKSNPGGRNQSTWAAMGPDQLLYMVDGFRDYFSSTQSEVWRYNGDPKDGNTTAMGFNAAVANKGGGIILCGTSREPIIVVGVIDNGIWRKTVSGAWTQVEATFGTEGTPAHSNRYPSCLDLDGRSIYMLDRVAPTGVTNVVSDIWRSLDSGETWTKWWDTSSCLSLVSDTTSYGYLYVCKSSGVYRISAANQSGTVAATAATRITPNAAPFTAVQGMALDRDNNYIYVVTKTTATQDAAMYECRNPKTTSGDVGDWTDVTDTDWDFAAGAYSINWVVVDQEGGQMFVMPASVWLFSNDGLAPNPGVGSLRGLSGYRI